MPFPVQVRRWAAALQRRQGLQGFLSLTVLEDVQPTVQLWDVTDPIAVRQRDERRYVAQVSNAGAPAQFSSARLINPTGSRVLVVPELLYVVPAAAARTAVQMLFGLAAGTTFGLPLDGLVRQESVTQRSVAALAIAGPAALGSSRGLYASAAERVVLALPMLAAETAVEVQVGTANVAADFTFTWREYPLTAQEESGA